MGRKQLLQELLQGTKMFSACDWHKVWPLDCVGPGTVQLQPCQGTAQMLTPGARMLFQNYSIIHAPRAKFDSKPLQHR